MTDTINSYNSYGSDAGATETRAADPLLDLRVEPLAALAPERRAALLGRGRARLNELRAPVGRILDEVRARGDAALYDFAERFDGARPQRLRIPQGEIAAALGEVDPRYLTALKRASATIERFHRAQLDALLREPPVETAPGVTVWRVWRPIERVGVYAPGGGALYPSSLLMSAIPARVAGCAEVVVCTPARAGGRVRPELLAAAALAGVREVYAVGGAQAIGALAYGTETIRKVDKIFGAGSSYVTMAKTLVSNETAIDLPAGPSEVLIVAGETANPAWVAADLLAQAEHGPESACVLVTPSATLAEAVRAEIERQVSALPSAATIRASLARNGALLVTETLDAALDFANAYAAEHLELIAADAEALVERIQHAGSIFVGGTSPTAAGDYASGGNHTLPTALFARSYGPLAIEAFGRKTQVQRLTSDGLAGLREAIETLATVEGLPAHAASIRARFAGDETPRATSEKKE